MQENWARSREKADPSTKFSQGSLFLGLPGGRQGACRGGFRWGLLGTESGSSGPESPLSLRTASAVRRLIRDLFVPISCETLGEPGGSGPARRYRGPPGWAGAGPGRARSLLSRCGRRSGALRQAREAATRSAARGLRRSQPPPPGLPPPRGARSPCPGRRAGAAQHAAGWARRPGLGARARAGKQWCAWRAARLGVSGASGRWADWGPAGRRGGGSGGGGGEGEGAPGPARRLRAPRRKPGAGRGCRRVSPGLRTRAHGTPVPVDPPLQT